MKGQDGESWKVQHKNQSKSNAVVILSLLQKDSKWRQKAQYVIKDNITSEVGMLMMKQIMGRACTGHIKVEDIKKCKDELWHCVNKGQWLQWMQDIAAGTTGTQVRST